jgi:excisionase family DNA binding protein
MTTDRNRNSAPSLADDLLHGIRGIAEHTGLPERRVLYLVETGRIPVFRLGRRVHARRSELDRALRAQAAG